MASKLQFYSDLADKTAQDLTSKRGLWTGFLDTSARFYKYGFNDQLLIYAQRPDAIAAAPIEMWNDKFYRRVERGSKAIYLIDDTGMYAKLKYVFEVNDTYPMRENARPVRLWEMREEHRDAVLSKLAESYDEVEIEDNLADTFRNIASALAEEYYKDSANDIRNRAEDSMLEPAAFTDAWGVPIEQRDDSFLEATFTETLANSVAYTLMARCGLDPSEYFDDEDFQGVLAFDTPDMAYALGTATQDLSRQVLRDVELVIKKYERAKTAQIAQTAERSDEQYDRNPYLQPGGRLSYTRRDNEGAGEREHAAAGPIRDDAENLPQDAQANQLQPPVADGEALPSFEGDRPSGERAAGAADGRLDGEGELARQGDGTDGLGGGDEHVEESSGGNGSHGTDLRVEEYGGGDDNTEHAADNAEDSVSADLDDTTEPAAKEADEPPSDDTPPDTFSQVGKSPSIEEALSTSTITIAEVDTILRNGSNERGNSYFRIAAHFVKHLDDNEAFLRNEYLRGKYGRHDEPSGKGFDFGGHRVAAWFDTDGIYLGGGDNSALYNSGDKVFITWAQAAERIDALMTAGLYATPETLSDALDYERHALAELLCEFYRTDMDGLPEEWSVGKFEHEKNAAKVEGLLANAETRQQLIDRVTADIEAYDPAAHEHRWHNRFRVLYDTQAIGHEPIMPPNANFVNESFKHFITEDEIGAYVASGSQFRDGKYRIASYFLEPHSADERVKFLKNEYGLGGGGPWGGSSGHYDYTPGKGIELKRGDSFEPGAVTKLTLQAVSKRIAGLMADGRYLTRREIDGIPQYEKLMLAKAVEGFYYELPYESRFDALDKQCGELELGEGLRFSMGGKTVAVYKDGELNEKFDITVWVDGEPTDYLGIDESAVESLIREVIGDDGRKPFAKGADFHYPKEAELEALDELLEDESRIDTMLGEMRYITESTAKDDRYYHLRARGLEQLTAFREGTYTLFPDLENLPPPENTGWRVPIGGSQTITPNAATAPPRGGAVINLSDHGASGDGQTPQFQKIKAEQLSIFDLGNASPNAPKFPSVEEQTTVIDQALRNEAADVKAASDVLERDVDNFLLNVSPENKARLYDQFADEPRSRAAVNLVKEIYGDALPFPLPQAVKRLEELVQMGYLDGLGDIYSLFDDAREELEQRGYAVPGQVVEGAISEFRTQERYGDYTDLVDFILDEYLSEEEVVQYAEQAGRQGEESEVDGKEAELGEEEAALNEGKTELAEESGELLPELRLTAVGDFYELYGDDAQIAADVLGLTLTTRGGEPMVGFPSRVLDEYNRKLANEGYIAVLPDGGEQAQSGQSAETRIEPTAEKPPVKKPPEVKIEPLPQFAEAMAIDTAEDVTNAAVTGAAAEEPAPTPPPAFEDVAKLVYDRVMADDNYAYHLRFVPNRGALRNPLNAALDKIVGELRAEEPAVYADYFDDDTADNIFEYVYKLSWENRPRELREQDERTREAAQANEQTRPDENAEPAANHKPPKTYAEGDRVVLDLREKFKGMLNPDAPNLTGVFTIDAVSENSVSISNDTFSTFLSPQDVARYKVEPVADRIFSENGADYYLFRYPDGVNAGAALNLETLSLITQPAKLYVVCAESCDLSEADRARWGVLFHNMPRDLDLLPQAAREAVAAIKPEYETEWQAKYGDEPVPRYEVTLTSDAFPDPDDAYAIWDNEANTYYYDIDDRIVAFPEKWQAEEFLRTLTDEEPLVDGAFENPAAEADANEPAPHTKPKNEPPRPNFRITDEHLGEGGPKTKFRFNVEAIQVIKDLEFEKRNATADEQEILSRYVGWGGLPQAFDPDNKQWEDEYLELNALLTPAEFASARATTLNAHYTSPVVIKAMWEAVQRMGFKSGNILEPSVGIGNFFGLIPAEMWQSKLYGVELDAITAKIAKQLYPGANIQHTGFEKTALSDAFFDLAIGNVPFGDYGVMDKRYDKLKLPVHEYFLAKSLDKVRPGGVVAFITSKFTMDKENPEFRKHLAQRAELLGAVRLPVDAFLKNAGTETTMDILFLQKRDRVLDIEPDWVHRGLTKDRIPVNRYYLDNPEMVLGTMAWDKRINDKYGKKDYTCCLPIEGADLGQQLKTALLNVRGAYEVAEIDDLDGADNSAIPADLSVKNFSYTLVNGKVYFRENSLMRPVSLDAEILDRVKGMVELRDCVHRLINLQLEEYPDEAIKAQQAELNRLYDGFIAEFGLLNSQENNKAFRADSAYYLLASLENIDEDGNLESKADMFTKRTIKQKTVITHVDTASEALAVSLGEKGRIDMAYMSQLTGKDEQALFNDLRGVIFLDLPESPEGTARYVTADEFLSGNVREKLEVYQVLSDYSRPDHPHHAAIMDNVEALKAVQPKPLEAGEIDLRLGSTWIDPKYVQQFMYELLDVSYRDQKHHEVKYFPFTNSGEWRVTGAKRTLYSDVLATITYGTERVSAFQIIEDTLNLRDVRVYDYPKDADGKERRVLNRKETTLAQQKQEMITQAFRDWIWKDPHRREALVKQYNDTFNSTRPREYDGSHIVLHGMNPEYKMRPYQLNAVARGLYGGNELLAHEVGAGKTFTMAALAMEKKRLGLCHKSLFVVPNHITEQWATEFLKLYPSANILVATAEDFQMNNRKKFCAKIASGDYDAVIIGHTQLEKIPLSRERQERLINEQIHDIAAAIRRLKWEKGEHITIKRLERTKRTLEKRLYKLLNSKKRDDVVTFEQLGVDFLGIDEAQYYKNLMMHTKTRNIAGLSTSEAQKSSDLFMKCRYMDELTGGKGICFATATPISNSITEMYTMQRYLQYDRLMEKNLGNLDAWLSTFGEITTGIELAPQGDGYHARTRCSRVYNAPELMSMFREVADIQTADMLDLEVPEARYENIVVKPSELQKEMVAELAKRATLIQKGSPKHFKNKRTGKDFKDNMLCITTDGRKIGLDQRIMNPLLPDFEDSKVNACADNVFNIWKDTKADRLTQLVFCDYSTPNKDKSFNVYDDIKAKLIAKGVPAHEIAFIHDSDSELEKKELFAKVRHGKVRVLLGSTLKMGTGSNVQDKLIAIHDLDCPWRPADLVQRAGRGIRFGNNNKAVYIFRYATSGTFDAYNWQTVKLKQEIIGQVMTSKSPVRSFDNIDEQALSYGEIMALCANDPRIKEKMELDMVVAKLRMLKHEHQNQFFRLQDSVMKHLPGYIADATERVAGIESDLNRYKAEWLKCFEVKTVVKDNAEARTEGSTDGAAVGAVGNVDCAVVATDGTGATGALSGASASMRFAGMTINGVAYIEKEAAAKALLEATKKITNHEDLPIGEYMGFQMSLQLASIGKQIKLLLRGEMTYSVDLGTDAFGNITRINHALDSLGERLEGAKRNLENLHKEMDAAKAALEMPFTQEDELREKELRLALLNTELKIDMAGGVDALNAAEGRDANADTADDFDEDAEDFDDGGFNDDGLNGGELDEDDTDNRFNDEIVKIGGERGNGGNIGSGGNANTERVNTGIRHNAVSGGQVYEQRPLRTGTYGKEKPSFLEKMRGFDSSKHNGGAAGAKAAEREDLGRG